MKKLICALVLLAMLVPVAAMAASLPATLNGLNRAELTLSAGNLGDTGYDYHSGEYTARYSMSGDLFRYSKNFPCGCKVNYGPDGTISANDIMNMGAGRPPYFWNTATEKWIDDATGNEVDPSVCPRAFDPAEHSSNVDHIDGTLKCPPRNLVEVLTGYANFAALKQDLTSGVGLASSDYTYNNGTITFNRTHADWDEVFVNGKYMKPADNFSGEVSESSSLKIVATKNGKSALYVNGKLAQVYIGSVVYDAEDNVMRIYNDAEYGVRLFANYNVKNGELIEYGITSPDRTLKTVYNANNILLTHEYWDTDGNYWNFYNGKWTVSTTGEYYDNMPEGTPSIEVLRAIERAPSPVTYDFGMASNANNLSVNQPTIIGDTDATGGAAPWVTAEANDSDTTTYNLNLLDNNGKETELQKGVYVALPLNAGITKSLLETELDLTITHNNDVYSTMDDSITLKDGLAVIYTESFSPFEMTWGEKGSLKAGNSPEAPYPLPDGSVASAGNLPQTGDNSNLLAYVCLLTACAAAFVVINKRRAHQ